MVTFARLIGFPNGSLLSETKLAEAPALKLDPTDPDAGSVANNVETAFVDVEKIFQVPTGACLKPVEEGTVSWRVPATGRRVKSVAGRAPPSGAVTLRTSWPLGMLM